MDNTRFTLSFVDTSLNVNSTDKLTCASIVSGFKFTKFERIFEQLGIKNVPDFVTDILYQNGYRKDYGLNMWIMKTTGISKCNPDDEFDEVRGRRIAVSRAKVKAYNNALKTFGDIFKRFTQMTSVLYDGIMDMCTYIDNEKDAIENVINYGVSNPE